MPDWSYTRLTILVPKAQKTGLEKALSGPENWDGPNLHTIFGESTPVSAHLEILAQAALSQDPARTQAEFRAAHPDYPPHLPVQRSDAYAWITRRERAVFAPPMLPFSIPTLCPITAEDVAACFPSLPDRDGWWVRDPQHDEAYRMGQKGWIELTHSKIGTKWTPSEVMLDEDATADDQSPYDVLSILYQTPYTHIVNLDAILRPILAQYGAKALAVWMDEYHAKGYILIDPAKEENSNIFSNEEYVTTVQDDGYDITDWDREGLDEAIRIEVDDADFEPHAVLPAL